MTKVIEATVKTAETYKPLIERIVQSRMGLFVPYREVSYDDLLAIGFQALEKARLTFNIQRARNNSTPFEAYASIIIKNRLLDYALKKKAEHNAIRIKKYEALHIAKKNGDDDWEEKLQKYWNCFSKYEKENLNFFREYFYEKSYAELSEKYGIKESSARARISRARDSANEYLIFLPKKKEQEVLSGYMIKRIFAEIKESVNDSARNAIDAFDYAFDETPENEMVERFGENWKELADKGERILKTVLNRRGYKW